jgi:hypothetical protein
VNLRYALLQTELLNSVVYSAVEKEDVQQMTDITASNPRRRQRQRACGVMACSIPCTSSRGES